jgi:hypothetical protein
MAWTQSQIDALKTAIASGVLTVKHGETLTTYRSLAEMKAALAMMTSDVTTRTKSTVAAFRSVR